MGIGAAERKARQESHAHPPIECWRDGTGIFRFHPGVICSNPVGMTTPSRSRLLHEADGISVFHRTGSSAWTLVTFGPRQASVAGDRWWGARLGRREDLDVIGVAATSQDWYPRDTMASLLPVIRSAAKPAIVTFGLGMGGYGALKHAAALGARGVLALSPHQGADPADGTAGEHGPAGLDRARHGDIRILPGDYPDGALVLWDPGVEPDDRHARGLTELPGIHPVRIRLAGHATAAIFAETDRLVPVAEALLDGRRQDAVDGIRTARREAPTVLLAASALLEARGHPRWAAEAQQRAAKRPASAARAAAVRQAPPPAATRPAPSMLGETASLRLWHWPGQGPGTLVVFTPAPVGGASSALPAGWWGHGTVARLGWSAIVFAAQEASWYPSADMAALLPLALAAMPPGPRLTYGSAMGGYGALKYGSALAADATVALAPAYSIDPADMPRDRRAQREFDPQRNADMAIRPADLSNLPVIAFDPLQRLDHAQARRLAEMPRVRAVPIRRGGPRLAALLTEAGQLEPLLLAALEGNESRSVSILREARRASPSLRAAIATALDARGHQRWAAALRRPTAAIPPPVEPSAAAADTEAGRRFAFRARTLRLQRRFEAEAAALRNWIAAEPEAVDPRLALARCQQRLGQAEAAVTTLFDAMRAGVWNTQLLASLMRRLRILDRSAEAVTVAEAAIAAMPGNAETLALLGEACLWLGREPQAEAAFRQALQEQPGHFEAQLGLALLDPPAPDSSVVAGPNLAALLGFLTAGPAPEPAWLRAIDRLWVGERVDSAIIVVTEAQRCHPRSTTLTLRHGRMLLGAGQEDEAIACFRALAQAAPEEARNWYGLTDALMQLHRHAEGRDVAVQAAALHPDDARIAIRYAGFLSAAGEGAAAEREARRATMLDPTAEGGYLALIDVLRRQSRLRDAIRVARSTLETLAGSVRIAMALGRLLLDVNDADGAAEAFGRATAMPNAPRQAWIGMAEALEAAGRSGEAEAVARRGLAALPDARELQTILGQLLLGRGEAEAARDALAEAIEEEAESPAVSLAMADAWLRQGRRREALQLLQTSVATAPGHLETEVRLGQLLLDEGRINEAADLFTRITTAAPDLPAGWVGLSDAERMRKRVKPALEAYRRAVAAGVDTATVRKLRYRLFGEYDG